MARRRPAVNRTPDSGYKFTCQACDDEVVQTPLPELVFEITIDKRGNTSSEALQCCMECALDIKEANKKLAKRLQQGSQVRPLREGTELPPDLQAIKAEIEKPSSKTDEKLDKLLDMMTAFMQMQMQQHQPLQPPPMPRPITEEDLNDLGDIAKYKAPKPKRSILESPKPRAQSKAKKPANKVKETPAKPKSRRAR